MVNRLAVKRLEFEYEEITFRQVQEQARDIGCNNRDVGMVIEKKELCELIAKIH